MAQPKKTNKVSKRQTNSEIPKAEKANIDHLFAQALQRYKQELFADKKDKLKEITHLSTICEEYLSTFALIGYSLQDEKVVVFNMSSPKNEAALIDLLRSTFIEIIQNRP